MSAAEERRKRGLELLHVKLRALANIQAQTIEEIRLTHALGNIGAATVELLGEDVSALIRIIASRRWDLETPEAITMARILQELAPRSTEGV